MSMSVMAYALKLEALRAQIGSGGPDIEPDEQVTTGVRSAFRELIIGLPPQQTEQNYIDALELLCRRHGRLLPNSGLAPIDTGHFDQVNEALKRFQLGFDLMNVVYSGIDIAHPVLAKSTLVGSVDSATLEQAVRVLNGEPIQSDDAAVDEALCSIESWLDLATRRKLDIVGFFY